MLREIKNRIHERMPALLTKSLNQAAAEQNLTQLRSQLEKSVPNISDQYTNYEVDGDYLVTKVRNMHAFQVSLIQPVLKEFEKVTIVDIGDSSGTHLKYLQSLNEAEKIRCLSVNLDPVAVEKIKNKGLEAIHSRAEELDQYNVHTDIFLCFETLEHLMNPCQFLHELSMKTKAKYLIITVPYVAKSRVGMYHVRKGHSRDVNAENTHIFELSPEDWKYLFQFSGWKVDFERVYYQYPKCHGLRICQPYWKKCDFEGFYGVRLIPDQTWSSKFTDW